MRHWLPLFAALVAAPVSLSAQFSSAIVAPSKTAMIAMATAEIPAMAVPILIPAGLPDAPSISTSVPDVASGQSGLAAAGKAGTAVAPKYAGIILPGQASVPLTARNKVVYGFHDAFNPIAFVGITISAAYSYGVDTAPHYGGSGWQSFGKREGVSALRNTVQTISTDALFSPIFRDDPRYYELGRSHKFVHRVVYAATRVLVTRSDGGHQRLNVPLLLGYGVAAGLNNAYYPDQDTGASATFKNYGGSLGGAAIGFEANEFLDDALRLFHLRK